ncbi:MAG: DUF4340 domain-containing protein [Candidatus Eisenbacteria bacterium]|nr:DUF4340 domain-containing protein [Candidatus Eisenbacteria bacterium]
MTRRPGFWILILLFVGLAGWLRYGPRAGTADRPGDPSVPMAQRPFVSIEPTRVARILVAFSIDSTRMERIDQRWWIVSPVRFPADPVAVEALLNRCRSLVPRGVVPIEPGPGDPYGVRDPLVVVEFGLSDGSSTKLEFGNLAPAAGAFYMRATGRDSLALIAESEADTYFRRPLDSWRDPTLFEFDPATVTNVRLLRPNGNLSMEREAGGASWRLIEPFPGRANSGAVMEFVKSLRAMKARSFPAPLPGNTVLPAGRRLIVSAAGRRDTLVLEDALLPTSRPEVGVRLTGRPWRYGVPLAYREVADRSDLTLRDRRLLFGPLRDWRRFRVVAGSDSIEFAPDSIGVWRLTGESGTPGAPPPDRTSLVEAWIQTPADSLVAAGDRLDPFRPGGGTPNRVRRVAVTDARGRVMELRLAPVANYPGVWAAQAIRMDPPRPGEVFLLPADLVLPLETILAGR